MKDQHHPTIAHMYAIPERTKRQKRVEQWVTEAFGVEQATSPKQRVLRFLEEAFELVQVVGADKEQIHKLLDYVFSRPVGVLEQELGGSGITLLALASSLSLNADECEANELKRVLAKSTDQWAARNQLKNDAGFKAV